MSALQSQNFAEDCNFLPNNLSGEYEAAILSAILALLLVGCGGGSPPTEPGNGGRGGLTVLK